MATIAAIDVALNLSAAAFTSGLKQARGGVTDLDGGLSQLEGGMHHAHESVLGLNLGVTEFEHTTHRLEKFLKGAGAFAIFSFAAEKLNEGFNQIAETQALVARGEISSSDALKENTSSFVEAIPVLGGFASAERTLIDVLDGSAAAYAKSTEEAEKHAEQTKKDMEHVKGYENLMAQINRTLKTSAVGLANAGASGMVGADLVVGVKDMRAGIAAELDKAGVEWRRYTRQLENPEYKAGAISALGELSKKITDLKNASAELSQTSALNVIGQLEQKLNGLGKNPGDLAADALKSLYPDRLMDPNNAPLTAAEAAGWNDRIAKAHQLGDAYEVISKLKVSGNTMEGIAASVTADREQLEKLLESGAINKDQFGSAMKLISTEQVTAVEHLQDEITRKNEAMSASVDHLVGSLEEEIATFGMSKGAVDAYKAVKDGATASEMLWINTLDTGLDRLREHQEQMDKIESAAKSTFEATRTPLEKYHSSIGALNEQLYAGAISWDTYARAVRGANVELNGPDARQGTPAREFRFMDSVAPDLKPANNMADKQLDIAQKQLKELQKISGSNSVGTGDFKITVVDMA